MLKVVNLKKYFGKTRAVDGVSFELKRKDEFFSLLGPSGCGKTTTLRIIAGLIKPDEGRVYFGGEDITDVPAEKRGVGFVFQSYALFPHMTVFENVAFGLRLKKLPEDEIKKRVKEALELVGLEGFENRYPRQLSGGQQQRVAIARAIAVHPKMLLFDEPLSNLDAKLRERVRFELVELQKKLKIPAIYVTHDQAEALVISDRIAVMNKGKIEQIGTPYEIYKRPKTPFVADFIGISNFLEGKAVEVNRESGIVTVEVKEGIVLEGFLARNVHEGSKVLVSVRPENIRLAQREGMNVVEAKVTKKTFLGDSYDYRLLIGDIELRMKTGPEVELKVGQPVKVELRECIVFPKERGGR